MRKTLLALILSVVAICVMASPVSQETTQRLATFFFHEHGGNGSLTLVEIPQYPHLHFYCAEKGKGFVIMAADDIVFPVLGYSTTNSVSATDIPVNAAEWFADYESQIKWHIENNHEQSPIVADEWQNLSAMAPSRMKPMAAQATGTFNTANLLTTTWGQSPYYNEQCPYDSTEQKLTKVGCVATAMAQIIKYWEHPLRGVGSYSYNDPPYGTQSADFADTVFNYSMMPDSLTSNSSQAEIDAVALLMRRCGIAVEMDYGTRGSASTAVGYNTYRSAESAFSEHFKYLHTLHTIFIENHTDSVWAAKLRNEIDNGRPVQYQSLNELTNGGHSFVCCGYDNTGKFYFNWGWRGRCDGYYVIGQLNPLSNYHYNLYNKAIIGIQPDTTETATTTVTLTSDIPGAVTLTGAGTYNSYTDWAIIYAMANPGYLFDGWDDDNTYDPFQFLANGGNVTHTAHCSRMTGDTLGYCYESNYLRYGTSAENTHRWGIRLDSFSIAPHRVIRAIQSYFWITGQYKLNIYSCPETEPTGEALCEYDFTVTNGQAWETITLPEPIPVDRSQSLWIILEWTGSGYPQTCSKFRGAPDGCWYCDTDDNQWKQYSSDGIYISWQIRGIFGKDPGPFAITVSPDDEAHGTTTGSGTYPADTVITITATPKRGYVFKEWNDGNTAASRTITVTDTAHYIAYFDEDPKAGVNYDCTETIAVYGNGRDVIVEGAAGESIQVYDATGRLVMTRILSSSRESISLPSGTYFIRIAGKISERVVTR